MLGIGLQNMAKWTQSEAGWIQSVAGLQNELVQGTINIKLHILWYVRCTSVFT